MGNQTGKLVLGIVLLVLGIGLIVYHVKNSGGTEGASEMTELLTKAQNEAKTNLEMLFGKVAGKWENNALWTNKAAVQTYAPVAKEVFGDNPSMTDVKILDASIDSESRVFMSLEVKGVEKVVSVAIFRTSKQSNYTFEEVMKSTYTPAEFKKNFL